MNSFKERSGKKNSTGGKFKRHIMSQNTTKYGTQVEVNWNHDVPSGKCVLEDAVSDTVVRLSDKYTHSGDTYSFDIMEFSGKDYSIRTVKIDSNKVVSKDLVLRFKGSLKTLLGCVVPTEPTKTDGLNRFHILMGILAIIFAIAIILVIYFIVRAVRNRRKPGFQGSESDIESTTFDSSEGSKISSAVSKKPSAVSKNSNAVSKKSSAVSKTPMPGSTLSTASRQPPPSNVKKSTSTKTHP